MTGSSQPGENRERITYLRKPGKMIVSSDLHGNKEDYTRVKNIFLREIELGPAYLVFTGDMFHGPEETESDWPPYLGSYYWDGSIEIFLDFFELKQKYPQNVLSVLGNHDHSHIGGPHTGKFFINETLHFEKCLGKVLTRKLKDFLRTFPIIILTDNGISITHAAPSNLIHDISDLMNVDYEESSIVDEHFKPSLLGDILWRRYSTPEVAKYFLSALTHEGLKFSISIYGHDIIRHGYELIGDEQIIFSTSFGLFNNNKVYLYIDLDREYTSAQDFKVGKEIRYLYCSDEANEAVEANEATSSMNSAGSRQNPG